MLKKPSLLKSKRGQAVFEILPATMVFGTVVFASLIYYRILREQQIRLEAVRNIAFAKINNSGPLTTVPSDWGAKLSVGTPNEFEFDVVAASANRPVDRGALCFRVMGEPGIATSSAQTPWLKLKGASRIPLVVPITTWAIVNRRPAGGTCKN
jgi:hypothetical protein